MIEVRGLSKSIDDKNILNNLNFSLEKGKVLGLIGPNGAGKSTLIKCLTGIYDIEQGEILYEGQKVFDNPIVKVQIGYVAEENNFFQYRKISDFIKYYKLSYSSFDEKIFNNLAERFKVDVTKKVFQLSKGMKMKLSIMLAMSIEAKYLILDEPSSGLDPYFKKLLLDLIVERVWESETTVIISSHNLGEIERICDDIIFLNEGSIRYHDSLQSLKEKVKKLQLAFSEDLSEEELIKLGFNNYSKIGRVYTVIVENCDENFLHKIKEREPILFEELDLSLEDIFFHALEKVEV